MESKHLSQRQASQDICNSLRHYGVMKWFFKNTQLVTHALVRERTQLCQWMQTLCFRICAIFCNYQTFYGISVRHVCPHQKSFKSWLTKRVSYKIVCTYLCETLSCHGIVFNQHVAMMDLIKPRNGSMEPWNESGENCHVCLSNRKTLFRDLARNSHFCLVWYAT